MKRIILCLFIIFTAISCKDDKMNSTEEHAQQLLYVNPFDTLANISFPNYLSLDTTYTWDDYSDCPCCGELKTRFQNKKDSSYTEHGFINSKRPPKYRTYVTFIFPEHLKCFGLKDITKEELIKREKKITMNMMGNDISYPKIINAVRVISFINNKNQRIAVTSISFYMPILKEIYCAMYIVTTNKRNNFPVKIKFEKSTQTSIRDFIKNCFKTIADLEVK
jgi:hypothetical protein